MLYFGVDYYPEHWPEERWPEDVRLMAQAGFNVVRLAEFAWAMMEPQKGQYDFDWLDRAIAILDAHDIRVVLGTPTASPPPWLMAKSTDLFRVDEDGRRLTFGNRREYCPNNPVYHDHTRRIVTQMAEHYGGHPAVIGWQIDNEFGERCYCPVCARAFQGWLQRRYGSLDAVNERWGTVFWSHTYSDWDQIPLPLRTGGSPNPGLALDFFRFSSDSYVAYQQMQVDILRERCPQHFVTHNFMGFGKDRIDYFDLAQGLDFVAWDNYPRGYWAMQPQIDPSQAALSCDAIRGLRCRNFWVMEQQAGPSGWETVGMAPRPGELRLWTYQAIAHGADGIVYFRWRTARFGTEQYWHGLLDHHGHPGRRYEEIRQTGAEIEKMGEHFDGSSVRPAVAMILSYDSRFAFQIQANNPQFSYSAHFHQVYRTLYDHHIPVDIVAPTADLSAYKLIVAPTLHLVTEAAIDNLTQFVRTGGMLIVTPRSGVKDEANTVVNIGLPGLLADLCGVEVEEYDSLPADGRNELEFTLPELASAPTVCASVWCDILEPKGATVVARYTQDYYAGRPAITLNQIGQGLVVYVGAAGDAPLYEALVGWSLGLVGVESLLPVPEGIEVAERWQDDRRLLFVLNHTDRMQHVTLDRRYVNLLGGSASLEGAIALAPKDVLVLTEAGGG